MPLTYSFYFPRLDQLYNIALGDCKATPTLMFRQALRRRNISGAALRPKRKWVADAIYTIVKADNKSIMQNPHRLFSSDHFQEIMHIIESISMKIILKLLIEFKLFFPDGTPEFLVKFILVQFPVIALHMAPYIHTDNHAFPEPASAKINHFAGTTFVKTGSL